MSFELPEAQGTPRIVLIGGGVRSGKSAFALARARRAGPRRGFIATAQALDSEMRERIRAHQLERGDEFVTVEEPVALRRALAQLSDCDSVVVDCLTLWLSNMLLADFSPERVEREIAELARTLRRLPQTTVLVTNEVGLGIVPDTALGRLFRDTCGGMHQQLARVADEIYLGALGVLLRLRPSPIETVCDAAYGEQPA